MDNTGVLIFKSIVSFISDLENTYGAKYKSISLYNRLLEKTGLVNIGPINKHIACFRNFFAENRTAMEQTNADLFTNSKISYSDKVYVDVKVILKDKNNAQVIWKHLLTIWGLIDPTSQAKKLLQETMKSGGSSDNEIDFLSSMIEDVGKTVEENHLDTSNPMSLLTGLAGSGVLPKLINNMQTGMQNGNIDLGKMVSNLTGLFAKGGGAGSSSGNGNGADMMSQMMSQMGPMISQMMSGGMGQGQNSSDSSQQPLGNIMNMLGNMSNNQNAIEPSADELPKENENEK
jgi:hypothetical protein